MRTPALAVPASVARDRSPYAARRPPKAAQAAKSPLSTTDEPPTALKDITSYNNFYEFGVDKDDPAKNAHTLTTKPWKVKVDGLVGKGADYDLDDLIKGIALEERIYRMRCVEGWSMVIPWIGVPLASVLARIEPQGSAKFVAFETLVRPAEMPGQKGVFQPLPWPYVEGLRLDEAMHPLTILAVGLYGETLPNQNGAPIRLVRAVEVRLQEHQVDRAHQPDREAAADVLEPAERGRVRLLFQRQSGGRSSALEPGDGAAHRRGRPVRQTASDAAVQRLRRSGREPLHRPRPQGELLSMPPRAAPKAPLARLLLGADPVRRAIYIVGMMPAAWTFYLGVMDQLGADPQKTLERTLGLWALRFLIAGLAITPLRRLGGPSLVRYRRAIGLLAFYYAAMHLTVYTVLDQGLDLAAIWADIVKRPYITVGMLAFTCLVPLAVTSNNASIRRLGGGAWNKLHKLVYVAAAAAAIHFIMLVKAWPAEPLIYAALVAALLLFRLGASFKKRAKRVPAAARLGKLSALSPCRTSPPARRCRLATAGAGAGRASARAAWRSPPAPRR